MRFELVISRVLPTVFFAIVLIPCAAAEPCKIAVAITPPNAIVDHSASLPGNRVQFSLASSVQGNCPMIPDSQGAWTTSDSENTTISNDPATSGLAVCLHAAPNPVTISNSSRVRGRSFPSAMLVCK